MRRYLNLFSLEYNLRWLCWYCWHWNLYSCNHLLTAWIIWFGYLGVATLFCFPIVIRVIINYRWVIWIALPQPFLHEFIWWFPPSPGRVFRESNAFRESKVTERLYHCRSKTGYNRLWEGLRGSSLLEWNVARTSLLRSIISQQSSRTDEKCLQLLVWWYSS